jgi:hypothetical protein
MCLGCQLRQNDTDHAGGVSDPTIIPDANAASRASDCSPIYFSNGSDTLRAASASLATLVG